MTRSTFGGVTVEHDDLDGGEPAPDVVVGIGPAPRTLAWLTPRRCRDRALDLGTGNGVQALLAAAHCRQVVATDINPRAVAFARANAGRNGIDNVDVREGDLFEPVGGERFDLIVANPPFVVSPDTRFQFRDGGPGLCARLLGGLEDHLTEGGLGLVMVHWAQPPGLPWWTELRRWTAGARADVLLLRFGMDPVEEYAARWNRYASDPDASAARWRTFFHAEGIEQIGAGVVALRRTSQRPRARGLDTPHPVTGPCGDHLEAVLDAPRLDDLGDLDGHGGLGGETLAPAPRARMTGGFIRRVPGLGLRARISPEAERVLAAHGPVGTAPPAVRAELGRLVSLGLAQVAGPCT